MNCNTKGSLGLMFDGPPATPDAMGWAPERVKTWFCAPNRAEINPEVSVRLEERLKERARIARDLHDNLLQGFLGITLQLQAAVEQVPAESPGRPSLNHTILRMQSVINEAREVLEGLRSSGMESMSLEQALSCLRDEFAPGCAIQFRVFVTGKSKPLSPAIREQIYLIGREALINALRHSEATAIEAEIEYLPGQFRIRIRDNGCGMDPGVVTSGRSAHWGLVGMRERAAKIGAQFRIWSRLGAGTEVEISLPGRALAAATA